MGSLNYLIKYFFLFSFCYVSCLIGEEKALRLQQIRHLATVEEYGASIGLYQEHKTALGRHDFQILEEMARIWIEKGARSQKTEQKILGLFAYHMSGLSVPVDILEAAVTAEDPMLQRIGITTIGKTQEDYSNSLLNKAMSSQYIESRLESAYYLSLRKAPTALGQIESLMYRFPRELRSFFPQFFAIIGSPEATHILRHLMDEEGPTKIAAILQAAMYKRDDLIPAIRLFITHPDPIEQEASCIALGLLNDTHSIKKLRILAKSSSMNVQLAALGSLHMLGDPLAKTKIVSLAKEGNLIAISLLANIEGYEEVLEPFLTSNDIQVRFNAALTLLKKKNPRSLPVLLPFLIEDEKDLGFQPYYTIGGAFQLWKVISSLKQHKKECFFDLEEFSLRVKEEILSLCTYLPEQDLIWLAKKIFFHKQNKLIPSLVAILGKLPSDKAEALLQEETLRVGAPLIRAYCNLTLFQMKQTDLYQQSIVKFIQENNSSQLIELRPTLPWNLQIDHTYKLTPQETSYLLIQSYMALGEKDMNFTIDLLLQAIEGGLKENRVVLASILLHILH